VGLKVLDQAIDTTTPTGLLGRHRAVERELIKEQCWLASPRPRPKGVRYWDARRAHFSTRFSPIAFWRLA
jgi:hypothetical protein